MLACSFFLGLATLSLAQSPKPCRIIFEALTITEQYDKGPCPEAELRSPIQWEGRRIKTERNKDFVEIAKYSYDGLNLRTRAVEEIFQGREREFFDVLRLYASDIEYRINLRTRECRVSKPPHAFFSIGIPLGAKFLFETEVGPVSIANEHLTQQTWEIKFSDEATYAISVTSPDCIPLTAYYNSKTRGAEIYNYFNITAGIIDPSIFNPPPECS